MNQSKLAVVYDGRDTVSVYIPTYTDYIRWNMQRVLDANINADNWRIDGIFHATRTEDVLRITNRGECEMALKIVGRDDFIGGLNHGDEIATSLRVYVDGLCTEYELLREPARCNEVKFVQVSDLYDPADHETVVAVHYKEYIFDSSGLSLTQRIVWRGAYDLTYSYVTMLPIQRKDPDTGIQVTDTVYDDLNFTEYDVSETGFTSYPYVMKQGARKYTLYSNKSGVSASVEIERMEPAIPGAMSFVQNTEAYNKVYFDMCGPAYTTAENEVWRIQSRFKVDCK